MGLLLITQHFFLLKVAMNKIIKWGILGCGNIANKFASDLQYVDKSVLYAVASNNIERGSVFAEKFNVKKTYKDYDSLTKDAQVDIVYIATTHNFHYANTLLCLKANKPVLCEKPLCINAKEAQKLIAVAKNRNIFFMEAMWTRFLPAIKRLKKDVSNGGIGKVKLIQADFGIKKEPIKGSRFYEKELGAGALLDLGIYTINFSNFIYDSLPKKSTGFAKLTNQKVDEFSIYNLVYKNDELAQLSASVSFVTQHEARIYGEKGRIVVNDFFHPTKYSIFLSSGEEIKINEPFEGFGYQFEAIEAQNCLLENKVESETHPLSSSLNILKTMDNLRKQWGVLYPNDI